MIRKYIKHKLACYRLAKLVEANRDSFETRRYREKRAAALKYYRRVSA